MNKEQIINMFDQNGNGQIDIEDAIILALKVPGLAVHRKKILSNELLKYCPQETIDKAVMLNPMKAGVPSDVIDRIADNVIEKNRKEVTEISTTLGMPGGAAMAATIPADMIQFFGYMLKCVQELMYLYGFPEINVNKEDMQFDSETLNIFILSIGVMYGVSGANNGLKMIANALGKGVEKQLLKKALTKGTVYPLVKSVSKWFRINMTKKVFAGFFNKAIPVVGGALGGGITYLTFKPCCIKLKHSLMNTYLSNPNYVEDDSQKLPVIDLDVTEVY